MPHLKEAHNIPPFPTFISHRYVCDATFLLQSKRLWLYARHKNISILPPDNAYYWVSFSFHSQYNNVNGATRRLCHIFFWSVRNFHLLFFECYTDRRRFLFLYVELMIGINHSATAYSAWDDNGDSGNDKSSITICSKHVENCILKCSLLNRNQIFCYGNHYAHPVYCV